MAPKGTLAKVAAVTYLVACSAVLAFAFSGRAIRDTDIVVAYAMLLLSFPSGIVVAGIASVIGQAAYEASGAVMPGGLLSNVIAIIVFTAVGHAQWFILVPWLYRKVKGAI